MDSKENTFKLAANDQIDVSISKEQQKAMKERENAVKAQKKEDDTVNLLCDKIRDIANQIPLHRRHEALKAVFDAAEDQINMPASKQDRLVQYAIQEFNYAYPNWKLSGDDCQRMICSDILNLLKAFSIQGHSGMSASYLIPRLNKLMKFEPLTKLTFKDDEFPNGRQNSRLSSVFKDPDGRFHYLDADIHEETCRIILNHESEEREILEVTYEENPICFNGAFPTVCMNDGSFARVSRVLIKDPEAFDCTKRHRVKCVYVGVKDWWESFTSEAEMRKVEEDYELVYEVINKSNPRWIDLVSIDESVSSAYLSQELFGSFSSLVEKIKPYVEKL